MDYFLQTDAIEPMVFPGDNFIAWFGPATFFLSYAAIWSMTNNASMYLIGMIGCGCRFSVTGSCKTVQNYFLSEDKSTAGFRVVWRLSLILIRCPIWQSRGFCNEQSHMERRRLLDVAAVFSDS